ncbi:hypothetical protein D3P04_03185 [Paracoccus onubensis]|uniref:Transposase n=1 Tax=Paracoccus onubensis TaxID=1675788 RepID=A0A418T403_9RHOB|nr:hypothetical protein D3P04_03185 [Paracoccus onubensis]
MTKPFSNDLREPAIAAMQAGESCRAVGARFSMAPSSVVKWTQRAARPGSVPQADCGYRKPVLEPHRDWLLDQVRRCPELTGERAAQALLAERGVGHGLVVPACGSSFKKRRWSPRSAPVCEAGLPTR